MVHQRDLNISATNLIVVVVIVVVISVIVAEMGIKKDI